MRTGTFGSINRSAFWRASRALPILLVSFTSIGSAQQLYVANVGTPNAPTPTVENFNTSGLTWNRSVPVTQGPPMALALGPTSWFRRFVFGNLYAAISTGYVLQYGINGQTGALTLQSSVPAGSIPSAMVATGTNVYVANRGSDSISAYAIDQSTGSLTLLQTVPGVTTPSALALDPIQNLLVSSGGSSFCSLQIQPAGDLSAPICTPPLPPPVPPPARIVFVNSILYMTVNSSIQSELQAWHVDAATGTFTQAAKPIPFGSWALADVTAVPNVDAVYLAHTGGVSQVSLATSPSFRVINDSAVVGTPGRLFADPRGGHLFVTDTAQNQVISLTIDPGGAISATGTLVAQGQPGQKFPMSMTLFVR